MDLDFDSEPDTAMGTIWAYEFNSSSTASCNGEDELLEFRLDLLRWQLEMTRMKTMQTALNLGCIHVGDANPLDYG